MKPLYSFLDRLRAIVREWIGFVARGLNRLTGGRLSPNTVTLAAFTAHVPLAWLIAQQHNMLAAVLLIIFGLFDALDGELARLQKRASTVGMLLDASTDRFKEVLLYMGAAYQLVALGRPYMAVWAVAACGASVCVSYVKAKGEMAVKNSNLTPNEINRLFGDGLFSFDVRMFVFIVGLAADRIIVAIIIIAVMSSYTVIERLIKIIRKL